MERLVNFLEASRACAKAGANSGADRGQRMRLMRLLVLRARVKLACWAIKGSLSLAKLYSVLMPEQYR